MNGHTHIEPLPLPHDHLLQYAIAGADRALILHVFDKRLGE